MEKKTTDIILQISLIVIFVITALACATSKTQATHRTATNFHLLEQGMTKQQFQERFGSPNKSHSYKNGDDVWEVWVFEVYKFKQETQYVQGLGNSQGFNMPVSTPYIDHYEYVAFKNGRIEEWGQGEGRQYYH